MFLSQCSEFEVSKIISELQVSFMKNNLVSEKTTQQVMHLMYQLTILKQPLRIKTTSLEFLLT